MTLRDVIAWSCLALTAGCSVDVVVDLGVCTQDGESYDAGETFLAADGCNTCSCAADGTIGCTQLGCGTVCIAPDGSEHQPGEVFQVDCTTCTCDAATLAVVCDDKICGVCETTPLDCPQPGAPDCYAQPACDPNTGWYCETICTGCMNEPPPICEAPMGCYWDGPYCDPGGSWTCGNLTCDTCVVDPAPDCGPGFYPVCDSMGWYCLPNSVCGPVAPDCPPPMMPAGCTFTPMCHLDGTWTCQEECDPSLCMDVPMPCELGPPNCSIYEACTEMGWVCAETCF